MISLETIFLKNVCVLYCLSIIFEDSTPEIIPLLNSFNSLLKGGKGVGHRKDGIDKFGDDL